MIKVRLSSIVYDTDGEDVVLPTEMIIVVTKNDVEDIDNNSDIFEYVSDKISEVTGYCHVSFDMEYIEMDLVVILYSCDHHHTSNSKELLGVFTNEDVLLSYVMDYIKKDVMLNEDIPTEERENMIEYNFTFFKNYGQTQSLYEYQLITEQITTNVIQE